MKEKQFQPYVFEPIPTWEKLKRERHGISMKKRNYLLWLWRIIYPLLVYLVISYLIQFVFGIFYIGSAATEIRGDSVLMQTYLMEKLTAISSTAMLISVAITLPLCLFLIRNDHRKQQKITGIFTYEKPTVIQYVLIMVLAVLFCQSANSLINFSRIIEIFPGYTEVAEVIYSGGFLMNLLVVGIAAPVIEELLFRGLVHNRVREYCRPGLSIVLSGLLFGIYHQNMVQGIYTTLLGLLLGYLYEKFHTILVPIVFHMAANITSLLIQEVTFLHELVENQVVSLIITVLSIPALVIILLKFRRVEQKYTVELPVAALPPNEETSL